MTTDKALSIFLSRLGTYKGFLFQTLSIFERTEKDEIDYSKQIDKPDFERPILGSNLIYRNPLTAKYVFAYTYSVSDKNIESTLKKLEIQYFNFVIAQCYEAFETFLKDIISAYLMYPFGHEHLVHE